MCKQQCGCQHKCAALRERVGWPSDLACVDPNVRETTVDTQWANDFLRFAETHGWVAEAGRANEADQEAQPGRCAPST